MYIKGPINPIIFKKQLLYVCTDALNNMIQNHRNILRINDTIQ